VSADAVEEAGSEACEAVDAADLAGQGFDSDEQGAQVHDAAVGAVGVEGGVAEGRLAADEPSQELPGAAVAQPGADLGGVVGSQDRGAQRNQRGGPASVEPG